MKEKEPVALWKGIVGTSVSGVLLIMIPSIFIPLFYSISEDKRIGILLLTIFLLVISAILLGINVYTLVQTISYRKRQRYIAEIENKEKAKIDENKKTELLHKLLEEGKITIEEYDELRGK